MTAGLVIDAREALLAGLIDDAGLFPPARKPMGRAAADHAADRRGPHGWMLGRFLCPASRLGEFAAAAPDADGWSLGVIFDGRGPDWLDAVRADLRRARDYAGPARVVLLEARLPAGATPELVLAFMQAVTEAQLPYAVDAFLEVPVEASAEALGAIAAARSAMADAGPCRSPGAKIRCGGVSADLFPPSGRIAAFIREARRLDVPFKATAGLHHPFRVRDEELGVLQHGFVNLVAATALDLPDLEPVVAEPRAHAFVVDAEALRWTEHATDRDGVARARRLLTAYGSCSFAEPVSDLETYGILPRV